MSMPYYSSPWGYPPPGGQQMQQPMGNQYQPPQPSVNRSDYEELLNKVNRLGAMFNSEQTNYGQAGISGSQGIAPPAQAQASQIVLIPVSSENEAWNYPNDLINGKKQYFIDEANMTIYAKWVDSNIDLQRAVAKLQIMTGDELQTEPDAPVINVAQTLLGVDEKLESLSSDIIEVKALISAANVFTAAKNEKGTKKGGK